MTAGLLATLTGIALVDSINPSLFIAQFYLFTTPRPTNRILAYIAGLLLVNFVGGLLILGGARILVEGAIRSLSPDAMHILLLALGVAALVFGLWMRTDASSPAEPAKPRSLRPVHTFLLGMVVMINELTTALPYFVAIERITEADLSLPGNLLALLAYNAVFSLPLFGFLALYLGYRGRFMTQIEVVSRWIQVWGPRLIKWLSIVFGVVLVVDAALHFLVGGGLF